jgi:phosphatidylethanolamine-binding protein (PEBP) family uncharacterized protein
MAQSTITVDYTWKLKHRCAPISPELRLSGIPSGTAELAFTMVDHDFRSFDHGGGSVKSASGIPASFVVAEGTLQSYKGPCNPVFESFGHDYEISVVARDAKGEVIGRGSMKKTFARKFVPD